MVRWSWWYRDFKINIEYLKWCYCIDQIWYSKSMKIWFALSTNQVQDWNFLKSSTENGKFLVLIKYNIHITPGWQRELCNLSTTSKPTAEAYTLDKASTVTLSNSSTLYQNCDMQIIPILHFWMLSLIVIILIVGLKSDMMTTDFWLVRRVKWYPVKYCLYLCRTLIITYISFLLSSGFDH